MASAVEQYLEEKRRKEREQQLGIAPAASESNAGKSTGGMVEQYLASKRAAENAAQKQDITAAENKSAGASAPASSAVEQPVKAAYAGAEPAAQEPLAGTPEWMEQGKAAAYDPAEWLAKEPEQGTVAWMKWYDERRDAMKAAGASGESAGGNPIKEKVGEAVSKYAAGKTAAAEEAGKLDAVTVRDLSRNANWNLPDSEDTKAQKAAIGKVREAAGRAGVSYDTMVRAIKDRQAQEEADEYRQTYGTTYEQMSEEDRAKVDRLAFLRRTGGTFGNGELAAEEKRLRGELAAAGYGSAETGAQRLVRGMAETDNEKRADNAPNPLDELIKYAAAEQNRKDSKVFEAEAAAQADAHPVLASAGQVLTSPLATAMGVADVAGQYAERIASGSKAPMDTHGPLQQMSRSNEAAMKAISEGTAKGVTEWAKQVPIKAISENAEDIGDAAAFVYQTAMSGAESAMSAFVPGGAAILGAGAGLQSWRDAIDKGATNGQAITYGIAAGVFEGLFESWSIGRFKDAVTGSSVKTLSDGLREILVEMGINFSEEMNTQIADDLADILINGNTSELMSVYRQALIAAQSGGMSMDDAKKAAAEEAAKYLMDDVVQAGLGGALMGAGFGSIAAGKGMWQARTERRMKKLEKAVQDGMAKDAGKKARTKPVIRKRSGNSGYAKREEISQYVDYSFQYSEEAKIAKMNGKAVENIEKQDGFIPIGMVSQSTVKEILSQGGPDISGYEHILVDNDIRHIKNSHGEGTKEKYPITADDIKRIPDIINNPDDIVFVPNNSKGKIGIYYVKRHNGVTYYLEQITDNKTLSNKQMIKVDTGTIPDIKNLKNAIDKKWHISSPAPDNAANAVPRMYVQDVKGLTDMPVRSVPYVEKNVNKETKKNNIKEKNPYLPGTPEWSEWEMEHEEAVPMPGDEYAPPETEQLDEDGRPLVPVVPDNALQGEQDVQEPAQNMQEAAQEEGLTEQQLNELVQDEEKRAALAEQLGADAETFGVDENGNVTAEELAQDIADYTAGSESAQRVLDSFSEDEDTSGIPEESRARIDRVANVIGVKVEYGAKLAEGKKAEYDPKTRTVRMSENITSGQAAMYLALHEFTHSSENSKAYRQLSSYLQKSRVFKDWLKRYGYDSIEDFKADINRKTMDVDGAALSDKEQTAEAVAYFMQDENIGQEFFDEMANAERTTAEKLLDWVKAAIARLKGNKDAVELRRIQDMLEKALRQGAEEQVAEGRVKNALSNRQADALRAVNKPNTSEAARAAELTKMQVTANLYENGKLQNAISKADAVAKKNTKQHAKEVAKQLGVYGTYSAPGIPVQFAITAGTIDESYKQDTIGKHNGDNFLKLLSNIEWALKNSMPLEAHTDRYRGTIEADPTLKTMYMMFSGYLDERGDFVPAIIGVKEFVVKNQKPLLYVISTGKKIETGISANTSAYQGRMASTTPVSIGSLTNLISKINPKDGNILEYIPDSILSKDQLKTKRWIQRGTQLKVEFFRHGIENPQSEYGTIIKKEKAQYKEISEKSGEAAAEKWLNAIIGKGRTDTIEWNRNKPVIKMSVQNSLDMSEELAARKKAAADKVAQDQADIQRAAEEKRRTAKQSTREALLQTERKLTAAEEKAAGLVKKNAALKKQVEVLKREFELSFGHKMNLKNVQSIVSQMVKDTDTTMGAQELSRRITDIFSEITDQRQPDFDRVSTRLVSLMQEALQLSETVEPSMVESDPAYREFYDMTGELPVTEAEYKQLVSEYERMPGGRIRVNVNGQPVSVKLKRQSGNSGLDSFYHGELLNNGLGLMEQGHMNAADIVRNVAQSRADITQKLTHNVYEETGTLEEQAVALAQQLMDDYLGSPSIIDGTSSDREKLNAMRQQFASQSTALKSAETQLKATESMRQRTQQKLNEEKQKLKQTESRARKAERKVETNSKQGLRKSIAKSTSWFTQVATRPTEKKHVDKAMRGMCADIAELMNIVNSSRSARELDLDPVTKTKEKLRDLIEKIAAVQAESKRDGDDLLGDDWGQNGVLQMANQLKDMLTDTDKSTGATGYAVTGEMNMQELRQLDNLLKVIRHTLENHNRMIDSKLKDEVRKLTDTAIREVGSTKGLSKKSLQRAAQIGMMEMYTPKTFFQMISGWKDGTVMDTVREELNHGQRRMLQIQQEIAGIFKDLTGDKKRLDEWTGRGKNAKLVPVKLGGATVEIPHSMLCSIYMHLQNAQNINHMVNTGLTLPNMELYLQGRTADAFADSRRYSVDMESLPDTISAAMDDYDRAWCAAAKEFFSGYSKNVLNETSNKLRGIDMAVVKDYFPIRSDKNFKESRFDEVVKNGGIENHGSTKGRVTRATSPMLLESLDQVINSQADFVSRYGGLAVPLRNFSKIWSTNLGGYASSLHNTVAHTWGNAGVNYINELMGDLNNSRSKSNGPVSNAIGKLRGNYAQAVLTMNPVSALSQVSLSSASTVLGAKATTMAYKDLANYALPGGRKRALDAVNAEIAEHSPMMWARQKGSTQEIYDLRNNPTAVTRLLNSKGLDKMTTWISRMDENTIAAVWAASKYAAAEQGMKAGTEEYWSKVTELFERAVEETQPNYTTMQMTAAARNPNELYRAFTAFKSPFMSTANSYYEAVGKYYAAKKDGSKTELKTAEKAIKTAAFAMASQAYISATLRILAKTLIYHKTDDDRDETGALSLLATLKTINSQAMSNAFSQIMPLLGSLYDMINGALTGDTYGSKGYSDNGMGQVNTLMTDMANILGAVFSENDGEKLERIVKKSQTGMLDMLTSFGVPAPAAKNWVKSATAYWQDISTGAGPLESGYTYTKGNVAAAVDKAVAGRGYSLEKAQKVVDRYLATSKASDPVSSLRSALKAQYAEEYALADAAERSALANILTQLTADGATMLTSEDLDKWVGTAEDESAREERATYRESALEAMSAVQTGEMWQLMVAGTGAESKAKSYMKTVSDHLAKVESGQAASMEEAGAAKWEQRVWKAYKEDSAGKLAEGCMYRAIMSAQGIRKKDEILAALNGLGLTERQVTDAYAWYFSVK